MRKATCPKVLFSKYFRIAVLLFLVIPRVSLAYGTSYRFNGKPYDPSSQLHYFNQRYYNADIGRFTQPDPLANFLATPGLQDKTGMRLEQLLANPQRLNYYSYSLNNPVNIIDPTGESPVVSQERQDRFNSISDYIKNDDSYWLVRDRDGNDKALDLIWQKSLELSKNDKGKIDQGKALDTFYDALNINWRDDKTLDQNFEEYQNRLGNLPSALSGEYGGDISQIDKLQHFAASARLAYKYGGRVALFLGKLKEVQDGLSALFNKNNGGYSGLAQRDEGYSHGDINANEMGILWINEYQTAQVAPSITIVNW